MKKIINNNKKIIFGIIIGLIFGSIGVYAGSKFYASDVSVSAPAGSNLGSNATLQNALDDLYSIASNNNQVAELIKKVDNLESTMLDKIYPVGSIYISTDITNASDVAKKFGGTWEAYGSGRTLISSGSNGVTNYTAGSMGGSSTTALAIGNLPNHIHTYTPKGTVTSSISGGGNAMTIHSNVNYSGYGSNTGFSYSINSWWSNVNKNFGGISSTFSGSSGSTTSCQNCSGAAFSVQNPYIVVYMYKRVK